MKTHQFFRGLVVGVVMSATSACGGCGADKPIALEDLDDELSVATCEQIFECCDQDAISSSQQLFVEFETQDECVEQYKGLLGFFFLPAIRKAINEGRVVYDEDNAGACIAEYKAADCSAYLDDAPPDVACEEIFIPQVADGGACEQDLECIGGTCSVPFEEDVGVCVTLPKAGEPCLAEDPDDPFLDRCAEDLECIADTCIVPKGPGEPCTEFRECSTSCGSDGMCEALKVEGEDCFTDSDCETGACIDSVCGSAAAECPLL